jgi:hypothetical protein
LTELGQGFENEAAVASQAFGQAGGAFVHELSNDLHTGRMAKTVLLSTVVGAVAEAALAKSPVLLGTALTVWGAGGLLAGAGEVWGKAWNATSGNERANAAKSIGKDWGRLGATFTESSIGMGIGGFAAAKAVDSSETLQSLSYAVTTRGEYAARSLMPQKVWFSRLMPGSIKLGEDVMLPEGRINAVEAADRLYKPFNGVETARSIDMQTGRASVALPGTPASNFIMRDQPGRISFHTHLDAEPPGLNDMLATSELGIIRSPSQTSVYKGMNAQFEQALKAANGDERQALNTLEPRLQAVVLDHEQQTAVLLDRTWKQPINNLFDGLVSKRAPGYWLERPPVDLDYQAARKALSSVNPSESLDFLKSLKPPSVNSLPSDVVGLRAASK